MKGSAPVGDRAAWAYSDELQTHERLRASRDQPEAIEQLSRGIEAGEKHQVLLGVTGSGRHLRRQAD